MLFHTSAQAGEFALMMLAGLLMAAACLPFAALRRLMCAGRLLCLFLDMLMGACWAAIGCALLLPASRGCLRLFHLPAMAAGAALFHAAAAAPVGGLCARLRRVGTRLAERVRGSSLLRRVFR